MGGCFQWGCFLHADPPLLPPSATNNAHNNQAATSGKAPPLIARMVEGRLAKYVEETCLLEQRFMLDDSKTVKAVVAAAGAAAGAPGLRIAGYLRVQCGEGLAGPAAPKDFAAEVADIVKRSA